MSVFKTISKYLPFMLSILLVAGSLFAHPGHGTSETNGWSVLHHLTSLQHLAPIAGITLVVIVLAARAYKSKQRDT